MIIPDHDLQAQAKGAKVHSYGVTSQCLLHRTTQLRQNLLHHMPTRQDRGDMHHCSRAQQHHDVRVNSKAPAPY